AARRLALCDAARSTRPASLVLGLTAPLVLVFAFALALAMPSLLTSSSSRPSSLPPFLPLTLAHDRARRPIPARAQGIPLLVEVLRVGLVDGACAELVGHRPQVFGLVGELVVIVEAMPGEVARREGSSGRFEAGAGAVVVAFALGLVRLFTGAGGLLEEEFAADLGVGPGAGGEGGEDRCADLASFDPATGGQDVGGDHEFGDLGGGVGCAVLSEDEELDEEPTGLAGVEVAHLDAEAVADRLALVAVVHDGEPRGAGRADLDAQVLRTEGEEPGDLLGEDRRRLVGSLDVVRGPAARIGHATQQDLVVI